VEKKSSDRVGRKTQASFALSGGTKVVKIVLGEAGGLRKNHPRKKKKRGGGHMSPACYSGGFCWGKKTETNVRTIPKVRRRGGAPLNGGSGKKTYL